MSHSNSLKKWIDEDEKELLYDDKQKIALSLTVKNLFTKIKNKKIDAYHNKTVYVPPTLPEDNK